jgi:phosphopantetheine--protein transferase-like protein
VLKLYGAELDRPNDSAAAHRLLAAAWEECCPGSPMPDIRTGQWGKPDFEGPYHFSLSHGKTLAVAALADRPVGVDVEFLRPCHPRLADRVLCATERKALDEAHDRDETLLRFWTLKEAYVKLLGTGLQRVPNDLCFRLEKSRAVLEGHPEITAGSMVTDLCIISWCLVNDVPGDIPNLRKFLL